MRNNFVIIKYLFIFGIIMAFSLYDIANAETGEPETGNTPAKTSPNFTRTSDPNVMVGKNGVKITKDEFEKANKNGMAWVDFPAYADYVGGWAKPINPNEYNVSPYYRTYGGQNIPGSDIALLMSQNDPKINKMLSRNLSGKNEVPLFGVEDSDNIRALIQKAKDPYGMQLMAKTTTKK